MFPETVPVKLTVLGWSLPGGMIREGNRWRMNTARFPEVTEYGTDTVKIRQRLEKRLEPILRRACLAAGVDPMKKMKEAYRRAEGRKR